MIIKVCGMRDKDNILAVENLGIYIMGFIFYPKSPRYFFSENRNGNLDCNIDINLSKNLYGNFKESHSNKHCENKDVNCEKNNYGNHNILQHKYMPKKCKRAGVFVNTSVDEIINLAQALHLEYIQLHGEESASFCREIKEAGYSVIKAFHIEKEDDITDIDKEYHCYCDIFLFDTKCSLYGGSGREFDWNILNRYEGPTPFLLSGGVGLDNLNDIKMFHNPYLLGVDLNSKFESSPGVKDIALLKQYITELEKIKNHE